MYLSRIKTKNPAARFFFFQYYSEKATKFCKISTLLLTVCPVVKSKIEISQNFVAFSECMNFTYLLCIGRLQLKIGQDQSHGDFETLAMNQSNHPVTAHKKQQPQRSIFWENTLLRELNTKIALLGPQPQTVWIQALGHPLMLLLLC